MILSFLNISTSELLIVLLVVLLLFGPQKLPEIIRMAGKLINDIKHASEEVKREITQASSGFDKEVMDAAREIRTEAEKAKKQVLEAVPRPSMRTFERASAADIPPRPAGSEEKEGVEKQKDKDTGDSKEEHEDSK